MSRNLNAVRRCGYVQSLNDQSRLLRRLVAWKVVSFTLLYGLFYFHVTESSKSDEQDPTVDTVSKRCTCGKNAKDPSKISCTDSKCPCNSKMQSCTRKCRCYNCKNDYNENMTPQKRYNKFLRPKRGCTCGSASKLKNPNLISCRDGKRKTKCPCLAGSFGCTDNCRCYNCGNIFQVGGISAAIPNQERKRRNRETVSPYKRRKGADFMELQRAAITSGPWRVLETLCLLVCREVLLFNHLPVNSSTLAQLYNYVAQSHTLREMSLGIATKSTAQIASKYAHLSKQHQQWKLSSPATYCCHGRVLFFIWRHSAWIIFNVMPYYLFIFANFVHEI